MKKMIWLAFAAALGLSACANLDDKPAHELMKISRDRALTKDYSFNFKGEAKAYISDKDKEGDEAKHDGAKQKLSQEQQEQLDDVLKDQNSLIHGLGDLIGQYPALSQYIANGHFKYQGAVDLAQEKVEVIPELELNNHNEYSSMKMPLLIDAKDKSLTIDPPASIPLFLNFLVKPEWRQRLVDGQLKLKADDAEFLKGVPLRHTMKALLLARNKAIDSLPSEAFTFKEMDAYGKQLNARYRVQYIYRAHQYDAALNATFRKQFDDELDRLQKTPEADSTEEGYSLAKIFVHSFIDSLYVESANDESAHSETEQAKGKRAKTKQVESMQSLVPQQDIPVYLDSYLDRKGRLLGVRSYIQINGEKKALNMVAEIAYDHYGKPVFTFKPNTAKTMNLDELMKAMGSSTESEK